MASASVKALSFIFFCFFLLSLVTGFEDQTQNKVQLGLYYESLCPYSANFIVNYLVKLFEDDAELLSIVDLHLSPWGNAKIRKSDNKTTFFDCQHGPSECLLNTVEACAIDIWPEVTEHFQFIYCVESLVYRKWPEWETCFDKLGLDSKPVEECYTNGYGKLLELQYAKETNSLEPPHKYVPWVVVDGQPLYEEYEDFVSSICKAYKGSAVPKACSNISPNTIHTKKADRSGHVSYKDSALSARFRSAISWMHKMNWASASM